MKIKSEATCWLLDVGTSGLEREQDSVIALRLAERLEFSGRRKVTKLLEMFPPAAADRPDVPPEHGELEKLYRLTLALFYQREAAE